MPRISLHAPACLGGMLFFYKLLGGFWDDGLGCSPIGQHHWLSWLLWLSEGAAGQSQWSWVELIEEPWS